MSFIGIRCITLIAILLIGFSSIAFGLLDLTQNANLFLYGCILCHVLQTTGMALNAIGVDSMLVEYFPNNISRMCGLFDLSCGVGLIFGAIIGSTLYFVTSYQFPFYLNGSLVLLTVPPCLLFIPKGDINLNCCVKYGKEKLTFKQLISIPEIFAIYISTFIAFQSHDFFQPILGLHLTNLQVKDEMVGLFFALQSLGYTLNTLFICIVATQTKNKLNFLFVGLWIQALAFIIIGCGSVIDVFQNNLYIIAFMLFLNGCGLSLSYIPALDLIANILNNCDISKNLSTSCIASSVLSASTFLGETIGPLLGGLLFANFGFTQACALMAIFPLSTVCFKQQHPINLNSFSSL
ncbi:MFS-type transporter SLC18B1-like isoform X2 [Dinothrombium tinctorium]|uniref:MFS-type transporter SLC18B1-like isoform X2 n=1 Tax=Dinothrombium tinctorium TaxID=1965070 RepID=A0A3S3PI75_9ACAR|nr:MFS-type transporter SLC18B1-like isoform X2 [Dinothrombium tinctorium]